MKKKIVIFGSTGSIGKTLLDIISKDSKNFVILLLTADTNYKLLYKQAKKFNVKNLIITNTNKYNLLRKINKKKDLNVYNDFKNFSKIFKCKVDYSMSSITGISGLEPTLNIIKYSKKIAIANKESIICGWNLINKELKKNKTEFIPVDSEHFSLWYGLQNLKIKNIEKIYLTASGGPFKDISLKKFKSIKINQALKHPNWKMGKKISIDSATMMNKVFEVIEAKKIFNLKYKNISILTHPKSYVHAIVKFKNATIKILIHEPDMKIPIYNSLHLDTIKYLKSKKLDLSILNNLELKKIDRKKFPLAKLLDNLKEKNSLYETVLVTINDFFVTKYLNKEILYQDMIKLIYKFCNNKEFLKYKKISPRKVTDIYNLRDFVSLKLSILGV